jgi:hypothetical protein
VFYESIGALLGGAAGALQSDDPGRPLDERGQRERRQVTVLLRRVGAVWPSLFRTLREESEILEKTRREAADIVETHRLGSAEPPLSASIADPLLRYRKLLCEVDELVIVLHEHEGDAWARDALRSLRRGLAAAAEAQGRLVDAMLAA